MERHTAITGYNHNFNHTTMQLNPIFTKLLQNNEPPTEESFQEAIELRSQANKDLLQIDAEIQRLNAKREQVQISLDIYNTILSPARRLLPDILREIFHHCLGNRNYPVLSATDAPMLLTRVCSLWRSVALSSPRIWSRLHIPLPGDPQYSFTYESNVGQALEPRRQMFSKRMQLRCQAVKEWLDRSGSCPLSLSISYPLGNSPITTNYGAEDDEVVNRLLQTIQPFAPRCRHLHLLMPLDMYQKLETNIPPNSLSMLRSFNGYIFFPAPGPERILIPLRIIELPTLEALSIACPQVTMNLFHHRNSWDRLTDICFESPATDTDLFEMLKQCHNLITLDVNMQIPWIRSDGLEPHFEMVLLPHLESLKLHETGPASAAFCAVNAPHLKSLQYRCPIRYEDDSLDAPLLIPESFIWLISNATASLEVLSIDPRTFRLEHVLQCLRLAAHVKQLIIGDKPFFPNVRDSEGISPGHLFDLEALLEAFTVRTTEYESSTTGSTPLQNDILLPNLESLEANDLYVIADESLHRILTSRIDAARLGLTSPLRRIKMVFRRQKREDILSEIVARARDAGIEMKLDLVYRPPAYNIRPWSPSFLSPSLSSPFDQIYH